MMKSKRLFVFLEFLIGGLIFGIIEDLIIIKILTNEPITFHIFIIVFIVALPFAIIGEYIVDKVNFIKLFNLDKKYYRAEVFLEFLIMGIFFGVIEDLAAFYFAVGYPITLNVVLVIIAVAVPFAFIGEYLIDRIDLYSTFKLKRIIWKNNFQPKLKK